MEAADDATTIAGLDHTPKVETGTEMSAFCISSTVLGVSRQGSLSSGAGGSHGDDASECLSEGDHLAEDMLFTNESRDDADDELEDEHSGAVKSSPIRSEGSGAPNTISGTSNLVENGLTRPLQRPPTNPPSTNRPVVSSPSINSKYFIAHSMLKDDKAIFFSLDLEHDGPNAELSNFPYMLFCRQESPKGLLTAMLNHLPRLNGCQCQWRLQV